MIRGAGILLAAGALLAGCGDFNDDPAGGTNLRISLYDLQRQVGYSDAALYDVRYQWVNGLLIEAGVGIQQRNYPNNKDLETGETRLDQLARFQLAVGWLFREPDISVLFSNISYNNASNVRQYERNLRGFVVQGVF